ncbi:uncharacterized protein LOC126320571 [Schistocerca gregaria]|uniref:uncharacterized protein LOC126320571 n=1 Tax=Schistocerca gregaria TaxID=7010 RepID=UPI00211E72B2|nr:uncharacterized protein LOC126320571 [Schistocerca gregaria]
MSKKKPVSADVSDQELLHSKLFFGSNQPLNPEMLKQHFSRYGTVLEVYLRPETGTSGNVTFYEMAQPAKLLKEHKYMELPDGSSLEIKEWSSRSDLKMKDIAHVKELRSEVNVQHRKPGHEAPSGTQAIEVQELSVPKNVALLSKTRFKLRLKNKSPNGKALQRMQCPKEVSYVSNGSRGLTASAPSTWGGESKRVYGFGSPGLSIRERGHADMEFEFDGSETKERVHRLSFVFEFGGHQSVTHTVTIKASQDSDQPKFDGDAAEGAKRQVVPAFPEGRQSRVRRWNQTFALGNEEKDSAYGLPPDIVKDVEEVGRSKKINPWNLRDNYKSKMHSLLFVEEAEQRKLIREYDMPSVEFQHVDSYFIRDTEYFVDPLEPMLRLRVPGLAEKRPSLLAGDLVYAWVPGTSDVEYEGYIHLIEMDSILVMFALSFHNSIYRPGAKYSVRFTFNRHSWLISHWALKHVDLDVVWPEHAAPAYDRPPVVPVEKLSLYDKTIQENPKQLLALHVALNRHYCKHKLPFLLFGPFGTGKTKTLVELLHQILQHIPDARVLICAPSNSAVDVFAVNLVRAPLARRGRPRRSSGSTRRTAVSRWSRRRSCSTSATATTRSSSRSPRSPSSSRTRSSPPPASPPPRSTSPASSRDTSRTSSSTRPRSSWSRRRSCRSPWPTSTPPSS